MDAAPRSTVTLMKSRPQSFSIWPVCPSPVKGNRLAEQRHYITICRCRRARQWREERHGALGERKTRWHPSFSHFRLKLDHGGEARAPTHTRKKRAWKQKSEGKMGPVTSFILFSHFGSNKTDKIEKHVFCGVESGMVKNGWIEDSGIGAKCLWMGKGLCGRRKASVIRGPVHYTPSILSCSLQSIDLSPILGQVFWLLTLPQTQPLWFKPAGQHAKFDSKPDHNLFLTSTECCKCLNSTTESCNNPVVGQTGRRTARTNANLLVATCHLCYVKRKHNLATKKSPPPFHEVKSLPLDNYCHIYVFS